MDFKHDPKLQKQKRSRKNGRSAPATKAGGRNSNSLIVLSVNQNSLSSIVELRMPVFPARIKKLLRYSTSSALSAVSGVVQTYVFRANSLFDPDATGTGHQPMGFDQLMTWYNHYCVVAAKITVTFKAESGETGTVCIRQDASSTPLSVIDQIVEFGGLTMDTIDQVGYFGSQKTLSLSLDVAKLQGITPRDAITADATLRGDVVSDPSELTYFHVHLWDAGGQDCSCNFTVVLEQESYFFEPRDLSESFSSPKKPVAARNTLRK